MNYKFQFLIIFFLFASHLFAESSALPAASKNTTIRGMVIDSLLNKPVEYANIVLLDQTGKKQITGTISDKLGVFELGRIKPGTYTLRVNFIGYYKKSIADIQVAPNQPVIDAGTIALAQSIIMLQGVQATAERAPIEYQIDKKVINVSKQYTAASGTAVDVLENVPSVTVDIEGNVSLRGSTSFKVLIDNRPSILEANDALQQIPASSIENIEIITNPSAKYDPDGTAGIINVITKKNSLNGINGKVTVNAGVHKKYGSDILLNYRTSGMNIYAGVDYNKRFFPGTSARQRWTVVNDTTSFINSNGEMERGHDRYGVRAGVDWNMTDRDALGLGMRLSRRKFQMSDETDFEEWSEPGSGRYDYISLGTGDRSDDEVSATLNYKHEFLKKGHELIAEADWESEAPDDEDSDELLNQQRIIQSGRRAIEKGPEYELRTKVEYTLPLGEEQRFEAGYQSRLSGSREENEMYQYNPATAAYEFQQLYSHKTQYHHNIHSLYSMYATAIGKFGLQGGLRGEYTYRTVELTGENQKFTIDRWDYFPTAHVSYEIVKNQQIMASYTRRIERPRDFFLEPFITWQDAYTVRTGNPAIEPQYIDSYEASYQRNFGRSLVSLEGYYRRTHNKIERVQSVYAENVMLQSVDNVGQDYTIGSELMINVDIARSWNVNLMGNLYDYLMEGVINSQPFSRKSTNWDIRFNNTVKLLRNTRVQFNMSYSSPSVSAQGRREAFFGTNLALRQSLMDNRLEIIGQVRDLFSDAKHEFTSQGADFYIKDRHTHEAPIYTITVNYLINDYKRDQERDNAENNGNGDFEEM